MLGQQRAAQPVTVVKVRFVHEFSKAWFSGYQLDSLRLVGLIAALGVYNLHSAAQSKD